MKLLKYLPKLLILPTTLATLIGLIRGYVPPFVIWMLMGALILSVLLLILSPGLRNDTARILLLIRDALDKLHSVLFSAVKGKDKTEILRIKEDMLSVGQVAEEAKLQGDEERYITLRAALRTMSRAIRAIEKKRSQAGSSYYLAAKYHLNEERCYKSANAANHQGERQMKWLLQSASHNWGNVANYQSKIALAEEEDPKQVNNNYQSKLDKFKKAAQLYEAAAQAYANEDLKLASSLEDKADDAASQAKRLSK